MSYLEVKDNKDLQEVVRSIKAEKDLVTLVSAYEDFLGNFSCKPDRDEFPYPKIGTIIDEEKSVKWNREEVDRQRTAFETRVEDLNKYKNLIDVNFKEQLNRLLAKDSYITIAESKKLFDFVYKTDYTRGIRVIVDTYKDMAEMYKRDNNVKFHKTHKVIQLNKEIEIVEASKDYDYLADKFSSTLGMNDRQAKDRLQQNIIKPIPDTMLDKFLNSEVAIKIYNGKQHDAIMSRLKETGIDLKLEEFGDYDKDYPYYHIDKNVNSSKRSLNASMDMRHVIESKGIRWCVDFDGLDRIRKNTEEKEKPVNKNKDQYER